MSGRALNSTHITGAVEILDTEVMMKMIVIYSTDQMSFRGGRRSYC